VSDNTIASFFGRKGSGKTTLVKRCMREFRRVVTLDTLGEYDGEVCQGFEPCLVALERAEHRKRFALSLRCSALDDMLDLLAVCYELRDALIVVEETSFYCTASTLPDELAQLVRYGRHRELSQFYVSRRPAEISRDLTAQSDVIVSFAQTEPRDLDYLRAAGGDTELIRSLPKYRFAAWGPDMSKAAIPVLEGAISRSALDTPAEPV
jgi:DNA helicase HerA-like ATPase